VFTTTVLAYNQPLHKQWVSLPAAGHALDADSTDDESAAAKRRILRD
jgi:hypothetical protein